MSQDKSSSEQALNEAAAKGNANDRVADSAKGTAAPVAPAADSTKDSGKRKESGIAQPVDALRQPADPSSGKSDAKGAKEPSTAVNQAGRPSANPAANPSTSTKSNPKATTQSTTQNTTQNTTTSGSTSAMDSNKQASPSKPSASRGIWGGIFLGLVLVAVALAAGLWWQQQRFETVAREVATRLQQSDQMITQARDNASQALSLANAQREVLDQLSRELSVTANELKTLQQAWEAANEGLDQTLLLNDLERLINMANQELALFGNVNSAVSILSSVDAMLKNQSAPALKTLQQAVITDLARLRSVPQVDVTTLSARLDSLIQLTGKAPLLSPAGQNKSSLQTMSQAGGSSQASQAGQAGKPGAVANSSSANPPTAKSSEPAAATAAAGSEQPWWQSWTSWGSATDKVSQWTSEASNTLMREFADVMSIRKADDPQALLLSEEQAIQLRANVRAMLLSAQLALMTRQADIWRSELNEVQSLLNTRYDTQALDTKASLNLLNELLDAPVAAQVPQLTETLSALASAERALNIPVQQDSGQDGNSQSSKSEIGESAPGQSEGSEQRSQASRADATEAPAVSTAVVTEGGTEVSTKVGAEGGKGVSAGTSTGTATAGSSAQKQGN